MPNYPLISVIIPNYNHANYLDERIQSVLNQTYQNLELIILDDKSTDNSLEVINKYRDNPHVSQIVVNEHNSGSAFKQWHRGIELAKGELIWIAESDDYCSPNFLEVLVNNHIASNSVFTFCKSKLVDEGGNKLRENHQMSRAKGDIVLSGRQFISEYLGFSNEVQNASCAIFNKSEALSVDKDYMDFKGAGDWLFWLELAEKDNVCYINQELNNYRLHNNTTSKVVKNGVEFHEMKTIYERLRNKGLLSEKDFKKCRQNNLQLIKSLDEIPQEVKSELYEMWDVNIVDRMSFGVAWLKSLIYRCII